MIKEPANTERLPMISVVTVVRNDGDAFMHTWQSMIKQSFSDVENIIIDGSDSPGLKEKIGPVHPSHIIYINEPDQGIYDAMNKGLALAKGEWVQFLNAGDGYTSSGTLQQILGQDRSDCEVIYGDSIADYGRFRVYQKAGDVGLLWKGMPFRHQAVFIRRTALEGISFDLSYAISSDFDLICALFKTKKRFSYVAVPVVIYDAFGLSNQQMLKSYREQYRIASNYFSFSLAMHGKCYCRIIFIALVQAAKKVLPVGVYRQCIRLFNSERIAGTK